VPSGLDEGQQISVDRLGLGVDTVWNPGRSSASRSARAARTAGQSQRRGHLIVSPCITARALLFSLGPR